MNYRTALSEAERELLKKSRVTVVGCGGTGGYVTEYLIRLGVGHLRLIDGDRFDESNLNRQLYCTKETLGKPKVAEAKTRAASISESVELEAVESFLSPDNAAELIEGSELVIDALDNFEARRYLHAACRELKIPLIFGAIGPWRVQVGIIPPNCELLSDIETEPMADGERVLSFVPALCASIQVSEAVKILCADASSLEGKLLDIDLLTLEATEIEL